MSSGLISGRIPENIHCVCVCVCACVPVTWSMEMLQAGADLTSHLQLQRGSSRGPAVTLCSATLHLNRNQESDELMENSVYQVESVYYSR